MWAEFVLCHYFVIGTLAIALKFSKTLFSYSPFLDNSSVRYRLDITISLSHSADEETVVHRADRVTKLFAKAWGSSKSGPMARVLSAGTPAQVLLLYTSHVSKRLKDMLFQLYAGTPGPFSSPFLFLLHSPSSLLGQWGSL